MTISISQLISVLPPFEFSNMINPYSKLNIYVDVKNAMTSLFVGEVEQELIMNSELSGKLDSHIFQSLLLYATEWIRYGKVHNKETNIYFCTDVGQSKYHTSIHKGYKKNRDISSRGMGVNGQDDRLKELRDKNFMLANKVFNRVPNLHFFVLNFLESDFLCHYLIHNKCQCEKDTYHVIISGDKDMYQTLTHPNVCMLYQTTGKNKVKRVVNYQSCIPLYVKAHTEKSIDKKRKKIEKCQAFNPYHIPLMMALVGDTSDDVPGVTGVGPITSLDILSDENFGKVCGQSLQEIEQRIESNGKYFLEDVIPLKNMSKKLSTCLLENDKVTTAFKLISYNMLINWLLKQDTTEKINWITYIDDVFYKNKVDVIDSVHTLYNGISGLHDLKISKDILMNLYP